MYDHSPPVDLAELLVDEDLLEDRPALAAEPRPGTSRRAAGLDRGAPDRVAPVARDAAAGPLELDLARLEDVADERAGPRLELELGRRQGQVHRRPRMRHRIAPARPAASRAAGTPCPSASRRPVTCRLGERP